MPKHRPVYFTELGHYFKSMRERAGLKTLRSAEEAAKAKRINTLTYTWVYRLESGQVREFSPELLDAVAKLYGADYEELVLQIIRHVYGVIAVVSGGSASQLSRRESRVDAASSAFSRLKETEHQIGLLRTGLLDIAKLSARLHAATASNTDHGGTAPLHDSSGKSTGTSGHARATHRRSAR